MDEERNKGPEQKIMISLLHPSRGRANKSFRNSSEWLNKAKKPQDIELIVSIDKDDPQADIYLKTYSQAGMQVIISDNRNVVEATNEAATYAKGDILIYLSDDFTCPNQWDELVRQEFDGVEDPLLIKVSDALQPFENGVLTIPIMNVQLYRKLGYFWHPEYKSMFVDVDLYETVKKYGHMKLCPYLIFPHLHHSAGHTPNDETYRRSEGNWKQGEELFYRRKQEGFPL